MATDPALGTVIRRARERKRWTQRQLAQALGVNVKTVDNWENSRTHPRNSVGALESVLGISLDDEAAAAPLDDLRPLDEWEAEVAGRPSMLDEDKRWAIISSRAARAEDVRRRRERRAAEERESARSGLGTGAA